MELAPGDTAPANLFDLNGRTLVFTPDGHGGYSRSVQSVIWEEDIGAPVVDGAEIQFQGFMFDFGGERWGSFFVSRHGLITFGEPLTYRYRDAENRFDTMEEIAGKFATMPTISPLYKPMLGGRSDRYGATQHVASSPDRVVVTWITTEPDYYVHGVPPATPSRLQVVLMADGRIAFNYADVALRDGIVGLFPDEEVTKGNLIASIVDPTDAELPGHLDLLEAALYETNTDLVILEFTTRDPIPAAPTGKLYEYRLLFDTDQPWWIDRERQDFQWTIAVEPGGEHRVYGVGVLGLARSDANNRIALLADISDVHGMQAAVIADIIQFDNGSWVLQDGAQLAVIRFPIVSDAVTDLSRSDSGVSNRQSEVFHYRSPRICS